MFKGSYLSKSIILGYPITTLARLMDCKLPDIRMSNCASEILILKEGSFRKVFFFWSLIKKGDANMDNLVG